MHVLLLCVPLSHRPKLVCCLVAWLIVGISVRESQSSSVARHEAQANSGTCVECHCAYVCRQGIACSSQLCLTALKHYSSNKERRSQYFQNGGSPLAVVYNLLHWMLCFSSSVSVGHTQTRHTGELHRISSLTSHTQ